MSRSFRLYRRLVGAQVSSRLEYRFSFVLELLAAFGLTFIDFIVVLVLFSHITELGGWSLWASQNRASPLPPPRHP